MNALLNSLTEAELALVRETEPERLAEARRGRNSAPPTGPVPRPAVRRTDQQVDRQPDFTGLHKRHASTRSTGARRQARRDSR